MSINLHDNYLYDHVSIGFIDFEDQRDAADAIKALDGKSVFLIIKN